MATLFYLNKHRAFLLFFSQNMRTDFTATLCRFIKDSIAPLIATPRDGVQNTFGASRLQAACHDMKQRNPESADSTQFLRLTPPFSEFWRSLGRLQTHSCLQPLQQPAPRHPQVAQGKQCVQLRRVLGQSPVAHLHMSELTSDDPERVFHLSPDAGLDMPRVDRATCAGTGCQGRQRSRRTVVPTPGNQFLKPATSLIRFAGNTDQYRSRPVDKQSPQIADSGASWTPIPDEGGH